MIRVGPAGWSYADWEGVVYPTAKSREFHPLAHLARYFECIELNSSFYSFPRAEHAARWVELVKDRASFRFTAKLHQDFTHQSSAIDAARALEFQSGLEPLEQSARLAAWLAQFPWNFRAGRSELARIAKLAELFTGAPLVLELRHSSWFDASTLAELDRLSVSIAHIDLPRSATAPPIEHRAPGRIGYLRLHGRNAAAWFDKNAGRDQKYDYLYDEREIAELSNRARELDREHDETYVITNNHFSGKAVVNALEISAAIQAAKVRAPSELVARYPRLRKVAKSDGQRELFE